MSVDIDRVEKAITEVLAAIGEDPDRDGLLETPRRVAQMYVELFAGIHEDPAKHLTVTFAADHDEMVMVRDIPFASLCEHHMVPFMGRAHVAYIPARRRAHHRAVQAGPPGRRLRQAPPGPRTHDHPDRRHHRRGPRPQGRLGGGGGRAPVHVDARGEKARHPDHHLCRSWAVPDGFGHPSGSHAIRARSVSRRVVPGR